MDRCESARYLHALRGSGHLPQALGLHVKYFTSEWWGSGSEGGGEVFETYRRYIESVKDRLPQAVLEFDTSHTLHDSEIKAIACDFARDEVHLVLHGWDTAFEAKTRYELTFNNVTLFEQLFPQQEYVESELGDLGYWEWEALAESTELRLLFVSSATFRLRFRGFSFKHEALQS